MWFRRAQRQLVFLSSSPVDEVWTRSTALACHKAGLSVEVAIVGDCSKGVGAEALALYKKAGIKAQSTSFAAAAKVPTEIAVTASSGLERNIFPTRAKYFVHMPHSIVSLHMIYPDDAFDGYDVLLAAGAHHVAEWNAINKTPKPAHAVGYGKLDVLHEKMLQQPRSKHSKPHVLIAPSWGQDNLLDRCGVALAEACVAEGYAVTVRPHPLFFLDKAPVLDALRAVNGITIESPFEGDAAIFTADILVGDYSGIGFEFAALRSKPVVSVDVGLKIVNPNWQSTGITPLEIAHRQKLGPVVAPELAQIISAIKQSLASPTKPVTDYLFAAQGECAAKSVAVLQSLLRGAV
ncbi:MAG: CDP-glycerol glycerophosphotransferase family protein [Alphaproteobacteria bacterium]|nr:CDP-glycerol glycerophosphotransferase family protein [Alphaproteobacteria bacterium]